MDQHPKYPNATFEITVGGGGSPIDDFITKKSSTKISRRGELIIKDKNK